MRTLPTTSESQPAPSGPVVPDTHCGYVTLLGAPNAGKSTLLNALVGEPLSIVTPKAQTTWRRITGIHSSERHQFIFLDTPGVLHSENLFHRSLLVATIAAVREADVLVLMADPTNPMKDRDRASLLDIAANGTAPRIGVVNKVDQVEGGIVERERRWLEEEAQAPTVLISALRGDGVDHLRGMMEELLPVGPFLYPDDDIASESVRFFVAEMVRETIFERYHQELPYASFCQVEEFREDDRRTYIQVVVYVERPSQKGIIIGDGGSAIRGLGMDARRKIEHFLDRPVYLDLWVKVLPNWRRKKEQLRRLGFSVPDDDAAPFP